MRGHGKAKREQYWQGLVAEWRASSLSVNEFCRKRGIAPSSIWYWIKRSRAKQTGKDGPVFLPVRVATPESAGEHHSNGHVEILVAGRYPVRVAEGFGPAVLDSVINVLENRPC